MKNIFSSIRLSVYGRQLSPVSSTRGLLVALTLQLMIMTSIKVLVVYGQTVKHYSTNNNTYKFKFR